MESRSPWQYYLDAVTKNYANFEGRARREEYWYFVLFNILIFIGIIFVLGIIGGIITAATENPLGVIGMVGFAMIYGLALLIPSIAIAVRRLHDTDKSGWLILLNWIPIIGIIGSIVLIVFYATEGTRGPNQYGPDPKAVDVFDEI